jgi:hypothetical protein
MFTIEMDWDETAITILDETGQYEDLEIMMYDDICYMRQFLEDTNKYSLIAITPEMMYEFMKSFKLPEGAYLVKHK